MGTVELLGVKPGIVRSGVVEGQEGVLDVVFSEGDRVTVDFDLIEVDFLFLLVFEIAFFQIAEAGKLLLDIQGIGIIGDRQLFVQRFEVSQLVLGDLYLFLDIDFAFALFLVLGIIAVGVGLDGKFRIQSDGSHGAVKIRDLELFQAFGVKILVSI